MPYYCPNCGVSNADAVAACYNCGAPNPIAPPTDPAQASATNPFEAPTQPQSPYQSPSYPPPSPPAPSAYPMPPMTPYAPPAYGQAGFQYPELSPASWRLQAQARNALIIGAVALLCCGLLGPIALAIGIQAKNGLQRLGVSEGQGMALVGIILGGLATVAWLLGIVASLIS
ncbi:MAG: hypothetical protein CFK52_10080 [Chloracidobacterium sp. CP2_5A]|nr:MAG: hypothetical protein CFK52_10080 [Chloracidobacterium sp. CP2_5A]